jgi:MFS family permease
MRATEPSAIAHQNGRVAASSWYGLAILLLCYLLYNIDRNTLSLTVASVRHDLKINDGQIGFLQGYAFSFVTGVMAFPLGWLADRWSRRGTLLIGLILWGGSTVASGFTTSFNELLVTRMCLGVGEAALAPAAFSLISDYFPRSSRGLAVGLYSMGGFAGIGGAYLVGGAVLRSFHERTIVSLPGVGSTSLWHAAFIVVGAATLVVAALVFLTLREPVRRVDPAKAARSPAADISFFGFLGRYWGSFGVISLAYVCLLTLSVAWFAWLPSYFIRGFGLTASSVGIQLGWVTATGGVAGAAVSGYVADWLERHQVKGGKLPTLAIMFSLSALCTVGILFSRSAPLSMFWAFLFLFADGIGFSQYGSVIPEMFPHHLRARSIGIFHACVTTSAYGLGPLLIGLVSEHMFHETSGLRYAFALVSFPVIIIGMIVVWLGRGSYDRARFAARDLDAA